MTDRWLLKIASKYKSISERLTADSHMPAFLKSSVFPFKNHKEQAMSMEKCFQNAKTYEWTVPKRGGWKAK